MATGDADDSIDKRSGQRRITVEGWKRHNLSFLINDALHTSGQRAPDLPIGGGGIFPSLSLFLPSLALRAPHTHPSALPSLFLFSMEQVPSYIMQDHPERMPGSVASPFIEGSHDRLTPLLP